MTYKLMLTGATGMLGRNIMEHPYAADWTILAPSSSELDLMESKKVEAFIDNHKPQIIVHAAGLVGGIQANIENPISYLDQNLVIGRNVIIGAYKYGVRKLINISSTCIYPRFAQNPLKESDILTGELEPTNEGYALAKIISTRLCQYVRKESKTCDYKTLIPCNLYGKYDNFGTKNSHLLAAIISKIHRAKVKEEDSVEIWGDGSARRQFMFAEDFASAVLKAASDIAAIPDVMNIGPPEDFSVDDFYRTAARAMNWEGNFRHNLSKPTGMAQKLASIKLQDKWGWRPNTDLELGIKKTYEHYCSLFGN